MIRRILQIPAYGKLRVVGNRIWASEYVRVPWEWLPVRASKEAFSCKQMVAWNMYDNPVVHMCQQTEQQNYCPPLPRIFLQSIPLVVGKIGHLILSIDIQFYRIQMKNQKQYMSIVLTLIDKM